jgi:hypothetical protein
MRGCFLMVWVVMAALWVGAGCGSDDVEKRDASGEIFGEVAVDVGALSGEAWLPLQEGAPLVLHAGLQGGYHVELSGRWRGLGVQGLAVKYEVRDASTDAVINWPVRFILDTDSAVCGGDGFCRRGADIVQLDGWDPTAFDGRSVNIVLTVERSATETYTVKRGAVLDY